MDSHEIYSILDIAKYIILDANVNNLDLKLYNNYHDFTIVIEYDTYGLLGLGKKKKYLYDVYINIYLHNYLYNNNLNNYFKLEKRKDNSHILKLKKLNIYEINTLITLYKLKGIIK